LPKYHYLAGIDKDNLRNDFQKFDEPRNWCPDKRARGLAKEALKVILRPFLSGSKEISFESAVKRAEKRTAPGYQFKKMGFKDKNQVFEFFYDKLKDMITEITIGTVIDSLWEASPKVEIRSLEKLINQDPMLNKQRTFMCADVVMYIIGLMLFSDQNDKFNRMAYSRQWSSVGRSIFYGGWDDLVQYLFSDTANVEELFACFDVSAMEASINSECFDDIYEIRKEFLDLEHEELFNYFLFNKMYSKVVDIDGNLGLKIGGNPSGCFNTLTDNTIMLILLFLYHLAKKCTTVTELVKKYKERPAAMVGDDSVITKSDDWIGLQDSSFELGFKMKPEITDENGSIWIPLTSVKFLNFGFIFNSLVGMWIFEPNYDKLFAGLFYNRKNNSWRLTYARLCAMKVLCYNNKELYRQIKVLISLVWLNHHLDMISEKNIDDKLPMSVLPTLELSDAHIENLIYGLETGPYSHSVDLVVDLSIAIHSLF